MSAPITRPFIKLDAFNNPIQASSADLAFQGDYVMGTNLIYAGYARPGSSTSASVWQIKKITYDGNNNVTAIQWPTGSSGSASSEYEFAWTGRAGFSYS